MLDVKSCENFYYLRDWNGVLFPVNLRLFFGLHHRLKRIVLLGIIDKKSQKLGNVYKLRMSKRWRDIEEQLNMQIARQ